MLAELVVGLETDRAGSPRLEPATSKGPASAGPFRFGRRNSFELA
jgi:hypothetical protein